MSMSNRLGLVRLNPRKARRLALIGAVITAAVGGAACHPKPGYLTIASRPEFQQPQASNQSTTSGVAPERVVTAELNEWKVSLASDTISAGSVTLQVHNAGTLPHVFELEGNGIEKRTRPISPDSTMSLTVDLKPGTYEIYCPLASGMHKKMGMKTDLAVRSEK